ncbi:hypothetical protein CAS74_000324 [Pichia kudriavzevii]|uniref:Rad50/SbcC-type AAA domain-containing protein n=1 Tax=Pichia kudriavzevii TaxID=4909 RepID=A0A1Z8JTM1_PICKU|nr:hypothetical protein CAS74_000324 [Pichia kudriavzevii]
MKRSRSDDYLDDTSRHETDTNFAETDTEFTPNATPPSKKGRLGSHPDESFNLAESGFERIKESQLNVEDAMTQVDDKWNKKRRKRTIEKMTQMPNTSVPDDESPSEAGVIERLELFNFMCHHAFSLNFGPQTNFIIGRNGSGKSAVLTGISVALGAKATDTDRGNSLKCLIMHGKNTARAIVTIKNQGPEAYMPEEFGDKIIIERTLRADRPHSLAIKNSRNKTISTTKKTVDKILEYFGITIANPMTILTQTEAKTFLAHSSDKDKFNSFMEGTRLKESFGNIKHIERNANEIKFTLERNQAVYEELKDKFKKAKKVWSSFKDSEEFSRKRETLFGKKIWVEYKKQEKASRQALRVKQNKEDEIADNLKKIDVEKSEIAQMESELQLLETGEIEESRRKVEDLSLEKQSTQGIVTAHQSEVKKIHSQITHIKSQIDDDNRKILKLEKMIAAERKRAEDSNDDNIDKLKRFKTEKEKRLGELSSQKFELSSSIDILRNDLKELDNRAKQELGSLNGEIRNLENKVRSAKQQESSNRPENAFDSNMNRLMIDLRSQRFKNEIVGPLGMHIEVKKDYAKWGHLLENIIQRQLTMFVASNHSDVAVLRNRFRFFNIQSEIAIRQREVFDYSHTTPKSKYPSILDVLKIEDESIRCMLVDTMKLNATLLVPNRIEAQRELETDSQGLISSIFCLVDNNVIRIYKRNNSLQTDPFNLSQRSPARLRIEGDSIAGILQRDLDEQLKARTEKEKELHLAEQSKSSEITAMQSKLNECRTQTAEISQAIKKVEAKLENLEVGTSKLESLEEEKDIMVSNVALSVQKLEPLQAQLNEAEKNVDIQIDLYKSISAEYKNAKSAYTEKIKQQKSHSSLIGFKKQAIKHHISDNIRLSDDIKKLDEFLEYTKQELETLHEQASKFCSFDEAQLDKRTTIESIDAEIKSITEYLAEIENRQGITKEQAELNLIKANSELKEIHKKFEDTVILHNQLHKALEDRLNNLLQTTYLTFQEVESVFVQALKIRRFRGKIEFNIKKGTLTLKVATKETGPLRPVESFSGGEKSYSQIAFLFAIWGPMHSRIRGLDEFDVFMDNVNRRIALKLILNKVAENPKRQTIFITPLSVANIEGLDSSTVHIHEISPPDRANL